MTAEADAAAGGGPSVRKTSTAKKEQKMTKRQRRKKFNETHKWPQHPKIQDMEVRNKAYIRVAGFGSSTPKKELVDPKLDLMSPEVKFGRLLGSTDQRKRHAAVQKLKTYLKARCDIQNDNGGISELDLLKLWKGLWYTLYMADKVPVQDELSKNLSELLWCVAGTEEEDEYAAQAYMEMCEEEGGNEGRSDENDDDTDVTLGKAANTLDHEGDNDDKGDASDSDSEDGQEGSASDEDDKEMFLVQEREQADSEQNEIDESEIPHCRGAHLASLFARTFFRTIKREWGNMDKYRIDKFYTLARLYIHEMFKYMALRHWNIGIIRLFNDAIFEEVLDAKPNGLRYHLIDIVLDELAKINSKAPMPLTEATFLDILEPYFAMCQTGAGGDDTVQGRALERVVGRFLDMYSVISDVAIKEGKDDEESKELIFDQVHVGTIAQFIFDVASDPATTDRYRKSLYDMHKAFMRRLKEVGKDVVLNETEQSDEDDDMEKDGEEAPGSRRNLKQSDEKSTSASEEESTDEEVNIAVSKTVKEETKSKKRKDVNEDDAINEVEVGTPPPKKKSRKQKKKTKESRDDSGSKFDREREEEVVTISLSDQKKAKNQYQQAKKQKHKVESKGEKSPEIDASGKRVKWLSSNKSKSYKASMKGLLSASLPVTSKVTPEKSILLNKGKVRRAGVTAKTGRKKAVNYF